MEYIELPRMDENAPIYKVSNDMLHVKVRVPAPTGEGRPYTEADILGELNSYGIKFGVRKDQIREIFEAELFMMDVEVATGKAPMDGIDGEMQILFNTEKKPKPKVREDGSVDYHNISCFEPVKEGQLIAHYKKPTKGFFGSTVYGEVIKPKPGKNLPRLRGAMIRYDEENGDYYATTSGKIEMKQANKIDIFKIYEISGDVDYSVGDVEFEGDVNILGDVLQGFSVKATGSIFVEGTVEKAYLEAGKDVVLKRGMQGAEEGTVTAKGNIVGKFFENCIIRAEGDLSANVIMNCDTEVEGKVTVSGKYGTIVGGVTRATKGIEACVVGNMSGVVTKLRAGITQEYLLSYERITGEIQDIKKEIYMLEHISEMLNQKETKNKITLDELDKKDSVGKTISFLNRQMMKKKQERYFVGEAINESASCKIVITGTAYPGCNVFINLANRLLKESVKGVVFKLDDSKIIMYGYNEWSEKKRR
ncbi:MAG: FapA family protein [Lachnospiraceae bacterium]|nr:FapA family protein [Lachnospiraceae bacterium]